ncbi:MAG: CoA pyrophosphatase [Sphingomonas sp.]|jgi:8-oxo-dGTP pyrophosphatase MutT (NUDIX family)|uniref:CoA pyrophosphatase n=1 Tax=Sphingomonas sp. TaxID=28214 RepID=UPI000DB4CC0B|nr:CoA pyrophosphatase [Sphingomonas sp.]PZP12083.1 MAG: CoA pyrophosphatase [Sphingomonas hengshuiensis]
MMLAARLQRGLDGAATGLDLLPGDSRDLLTLATPPTPAAVLIPVTDRAEPGVILTRRTDTLRRHAGQVAFPGGRIDPEDADAAAAALREAAEEIALPPAAVRVIGAGDRYRTGTGYDITPIIGIVPPDLALIPSEAEVAAVFEVPLAFLIDPANHHRATAEWQGKARQFYEIHWDGHRIWGATAGMIVNLARRLA